LKKIFTVEQPSAHALIFHWQLSLKSLDLTLSLHLCGDYGELSITDAPMQPFQGDLINKYLKIQKTIEIYICLI